MTDIIRNRTIRPSSRLETSRSYKIDTKPVSRGDTLIVNIDHESKSFKRSFRFKGSDVASKDSICFRVNDYENSIDISWSGAHPIGKEIQSSENITPHRLIPVQQTKVVPKTLLPRTSTGNQKTSFDPISSSETRILILGTMPGDKSLSLHEYYAHPRNRFWKIIAALTNQPIPFSYDEKINLLHSANIGIWDIAHKAIRDGSLDNNLQDEVPNDLNDFMSRHEKIDVVVFNGKKSELLFDKYFKRHKKVQYYSLPSTSPANTGVNFNIILEEWKKIFPTK